MNLTIEACKYCFIASCKDLPFFKAVHGIAFYLDLGLRLSTVNLRCLHCVYIGRGIR